MTWNDGRFIRPPDVESLTGRYGYAQVLVIKSTDGGVSWSSPVRVNDDRLLALPSGRGVDHFMPAADVDNTGRVGICWYDRRNSPINLFVSRFCAVSTDGGNTWNNQGIPGTWLPYKSADVLVNPYYLGDYDTVVSDSLKLLPGFLGTYGTVDFGPGVFVPNQNVYAVSF